MGLLWAILMRTLGDTPERGDSGEIREGANRRPSMRFQPRLNVMRFSTRADDAQTDGLVVLELEFQNGLDDGLTHRQSVLRFALLDDAQTGNSVVVGQKSVQGQRDFHRTGDPDNVPDHEFESFRFFDSERQHALDLVPVKGATNQTDAFAHALSTSAILFEDSLHGSDHRLRHRIDLKVDALTDLG